MARSHYVRCSLVLVQALLFSASLCACGVESDAVGQLKQPVIYETDGRLEYYEAPKIEQTIARRSVVALIPSDRLSFDARDAVTFSSDPYLCMDERFVEQPNVALCTGVAVGKDLILTAGHCVRTHALKSLRVVYGYYYDGKTSLSVTRDKILTPIEIVSERMDPPGFIPRLDYALIRIDVKDRSLIEPVKTTAERDDDSWVSISASGGLPLKFDFGGRIIDSRDQFSDYVIASTDTSGGSSGGGLFDQQGRLFAILARGADDFVESDGGCLRQRIAGENSAAEEYTRAAAVIAAACEDSPTLFDGCEPLPVHGKRTVPRLERETTCSFTIGRLGATCTSKYWPYGLMMMLIAIIRKHGNRRPAVR